MKPSAADVERERRHAISVPSVDTLSVAQTCGRACVWCAVDLTTETAVELGSRSEGDFVWFPRACRFCASRPAYLALLDHIQSCEQCVDEAASCAEGSALRRTLRKARQ